MLDLKKIRKRSILSTRRLGLEVNESLPLLDQVNNPRNEQEILNRILTLYVIVAHSYGFPASKALIWLDKESLREELTLKENLYLTKGLGDPRIFQSQVESLWALTWITSITQQFEFKTLCPNNFISYFPDLKIQEKSTTFRNMSQLRKIKDIIEQADLAYCLQWSLTHSTFQGSKEAKSIPIYMVVNRRKAIDWVLWNEPWEEVPLDT